MRTAKEIFDQAIKDIRVPEYEKPDDQHESYRSLQLPQRADPCGNATIGRGIFVEGEIEGTDSLFIDGKVEGSIDILANRVTVGTNGVVNGSIGAREIVVLGEVKGHLKASQRVDIRAGATLIGNVVAARISIEDGALFRGKVDILMPGELLLGKGESLEWSVEVLATLSSNINWNLIYTESCCT